jgi:hypothetical protein
MWNVTSTYNATTFMWEKTGSVQPAGSFKDFVDAGIDSEGTWTLVVSKGWLGAAMMGDLTKFNLEIETGSKDSVTASTDAKTIMIRAQEAVTMDNITISTLDNAGELVNGAGDILSADFTDSMDLDLDSIGTPTDDATGLDDNVNDTYNFDSW